MPIAAEVAEIINEPVRKLETSMELLRRMEVHDFATTGDALAALQYLVMQHVTAINKATLIIAREVDRLANK
ncbi:MAG: hypothetical protein QOI95_3358 [Acidimicrobiaceae bacterium]|jgi:hypothetical protein